jgi:EAL domain-containing protein (putative c-di-GMP-specific phosphodiesterase class I)
VEALLRWPHPQRGFVPPDEFIAVAESIGLIEELGAWVLRTACAQVSRWDGLTLAVNVSPLQLGPGLPPRVRTALASAGLAPDRLTLEITETLFAGEDRQVLAGLQEIAATGARLSVDDFGTGHSSLSRLHTFPIHELKIDKSFVIPLATGEVSDGLVAGIIALAHGIDLEVVAEGVESAEAYRRLQHLGCERAQGYHLGRPVPPEDIDTLLRQHPTHRAAEA